MQQCEKCPTINTGVNFGSPVGTPVRSPGSGTVISINTDPNTCCGIYLKIDHGNGFSSIYCHLQSVSVSQNQHVARGDVIATSGKTGTCTTEPLLHFGWQVNNQNVDPLKYIGDSASFSSGSISLLNDQNKNNKCDNEESGPNDDPDGDGIPNSADLDDDNDGIPDSAEDEKCILLADCDGDHIPDSMDPNPKQTNPDIDGDCIPNNEDNDWNNDGKPNPATINDDTTQTNSLVCQGCEIRGISRSQPNSQSTGDQIIHDTRLEICVTGGCDINKCLGFISEKTSLITSSKTSVSIEDQRLIFQGRGVTKEELDKITSFSFAKSQCTLEVEKTDSIRYMSDQGLANISPLSNSLIKCPDKRYKNKQEFQRGVIELLDDINNFYKELNKHIKIIKDGLLKQKSLCKSKINEFKSKYNPCELNALETITEETIGKESFNPSICEQTAQDMCLKPEGIDQCIPGKDQSNLLQNIDKCPLCIIMPCCPGTDCVVSCSDDDNPTEPSHAFWLEKGCEKTYVCDSIIKEGSPNTDLGITKCSCTSGDKSCPYRTINDPFHWNPHIDTDPARVSLKTEIISYHSLVFATALKACYRNVVDLKDICIVDGAKEFLGISKEVGPTKLLEAIDPLISYIDSYTTISYPAYRKDMLNIINLEEKRANLQSETKETLAKYVNRLEKSSEALNNLNMPVQTFQNKLEQFIRLNGKSSFQQDIGTKSHVYNQLKSYTLVNTEGWLFSQVCKLDGSVDQNIFTSSCRLTKPLTKKEIKARNSQFSCGSAYCHPNNPRLGKCKNDLDITITIEDSSIDRWSQKHRNSVGQIGALNPDSLFLSSTNCFDYQTDKPQSQTPTDETDNDECTQYCQKQGGVKGYCHPELSTCICTINGRQRPTSQSCSGGVSSGTNQRLKACCERLTGRASTTSHIRTNSLATQTTPGKSFSGTVEVLPNSEVHSKGLLKAKQNYQIIDCRTGKSFTVQSLYGTDPYHSDVYPLTAADTEMLRNIRNYNAKFLAWCPKKTYASQLWIRRPLAVIVNDGGKQRIIAASWHGCPHHEGIDGYKFSSGTTLDSHSTSNNYPGHFCIHFYQGRTHGGRLDQKHQNAVQEAKSQCQLSNIIITPTEDSRSSLQFHQSTYTWCQDGSGDLCCVTGGMEESVKITEHNCQITCADLCEAKHSENSPLRAQCKARCDPTNCKTQKNGTKCGSEERPGLCCNEKCIIGAKQCDYHSSDKDNDGIPDKNEDKECVGTDDCDDDGLPDGRDCRPKDPDPDEDTVKDGDETIGCTLAPNCDEDTKKDAEDENDHENQLTWPKNEDHDTDSVKNGDEEYGCSNAEDCDCDGLPDKLDPNDKDWDSDDDGIRDGDEETNCTEKIDCDGDGVSDKEENDNEANQNSKLCENKAQGDSCGEPDGEKGMCCNNKCIPGATSCTFDVCDNVTDGKECVAGEEKGICCDHICRTGASACSIFCEGKKEGEPCGNNTQKGLCCQTQCVENAVSCGTVTPFCEMSENDVSCETYDKVAGLCCNDKCIPNATVCSLKDSCIIEQDGLQCFYNSITGMCCGHVCVANALKCQQSPTCASLCSQHFKDNNEYLASCTRICENINIDCEKSCLENTDETNARIACMEKCTNFRDNDNDNYLDEDPKDRNDNDNDGFMDEDGSGIDIRESTLECEKICLSSEHSLSCIRLCRTISPFIHATATLEKKGVKQNMIMEGEDAFLKIELVNNHDLPFKGTFSLSLVEKTNCQCNHCENQENCVCQCDEKTIDVETNSIESFVPNEKKKYTVIVKSNKMLANASYTPIITIFDEKGLEVGTYHNKLYTVVEKKHVTIYDAFFVVDNVERDKVIYPGSDVYAKVVFASKVVPANVIIYLVNSTGIKHNTLNITGKITPISSKSKINALSETYRIPTHSEHQDLRIRVVVKNKEGLTIYDEILSQKDNIGNACESQYISPQCLHAIQHGQPGFFDSLSYIYPLRLYITEATFIDESKSEIKEIYEEKEISYTISLINDANQSFKGTIIMGPIDERGNLIEEAKEEIKTEIEEEKVRDDDDIAIGTTFNGKPLFAKMNKKYRLQINATDEKKVVWLSTVVNKEKWPYSELAVVDPNKNRFGTNIIYYTFKTEGCYLEITCSDCSPACTLSIKEQDCYVDFGLCDCPCKVNYDRAREEV